MGLAAGGGALAMAGARALPIVVVVLGGAHDEEAFARDFARALASGGPTVVAA
jgi:hypothetical protein